MRRLIAPTQWPPVNDSAGAFADPQVIYDEMAAEVDHPRGSTPHELCLAFPRSSRGSANRWVTQATRMSVPTSCAISSRS